MSVRLRRLPVIIVLLAMMLGVAVPGSFAATSPEVSWPQFQGGSGHAGESLDGPVAPFSESWTFAASGVVGASTPVVLNERTYVTTEDAVVALETTTGEQVWSVERVGHPQGSSPLGSPAIAERGGEPWLLYTEGRNEETMLMGIDLAKAERSAVPDDGPTPMQLLQAQATSSSGVTVAGTTALLGDDQGRLYAFDLEKGEQAWMIDVGDTPLLAPLVADDEFVYVASSDAQGRTTISARSLDTGAKHYAVSPGVFGPGLSSLSLVDDVLFTVFGESAGRGGSVFAFNASNGSLKWTQRVLRLTIARPRSIKSPAVSQGMVFVSDASGGLFAIDASTGALRWDYQFGSAKTYQSAPLVSGDTVLYGTEEGDIVGVSLESGHQIWTDATGAGAIKSMAVAGDQVLVAKGGEEGGVRSYRADQEMARTDLVSPTTLDLPRMVLAFALAFVVLGGVLVLAGLLARALIRRRPEPPVDPFEAALEDSDADESKDDDGGSFRPPGGESR